MRVRSLAPQILWSPKVPGSLVSVIPLTAMSHASRPTENIDDPRDGEDPQLSDVGGAEGDSRLAQGHRSPITVSQAMRRHPLLAILPALLLLAAGIVVGVKKHPSYSATATINVGKSDINTQATPGYVLASEALASTYSRLVMSQHVAIPVANALKEPASAVGSALSAVPVPSEPTFTITATGTSSRDATARANAAVTALQRYVSQSETQQGGPAQLLSKYESKLTRANLLQVASSKLKRRLDAQVPGVTQAQVTRAQVASQVAQLQAQTLASAYQSLGQNGSAPQLDVLINPTGTTSNNRTANIEKYGIVGAVAGIVLGLALVALLGTLEARRRVRRA